MKPTRFPKWLRKLLRRRMLVALLIIAQAAFFVYLVVSGSMLSQRLIAIAVEWLYNLVKPLPIGPLLAMILSVPHTRSPLSVFPSYSIVQSY